MPTPKQSAEAMIRSLPEDATFEDIQYKLYVLEQVEAGEKSLAEDGGMTTEGARAQLGKWLVN